MDFPYYIYTVPLYHYEVIGLHLIGLGVAAPYLTAPSRAAVSSGGTVWRYLLAYRASSELHSHHTCPYTELLSSLFRHMSGGGGGGG